MGQLKGKKEVEEHFTKTFQMRSTDAFVLPIVFLKVKLVFREKFDILTASFCYLYVVSYIFEIYVTVVINSKRQGFALN